MPHPHPVQWRSDEGGAAARPRGRGAEQLVAKRRIRRARGRTNPRSSRLGARVARGATYYGKARRGRGVRIRSGASRTYYIGIESAMPAVPGIGEAPLKALCVVPFGMEEGTEAAIPGREFGLVVGEPVEFRFLSSSVRKQDHVGSLLEDWVPTSRNSARLRSRSNWMASRERSYRCGLRLGSPNSEPSRSGAYLATARNAGSLS